MKPCFTVKASYGIQQTSYLPTGQQRSTRLILEDSISMEAACEVLTVLLNYQSEWDISHKTNCQSLSLHPQLEPVTSLTLYLCLPLMAQATCTASWLTYTSSTRRLTNSSFKISSFPAGRVYPLRIQSAAKPSAHNSLWYKQCYTMRALSHSAPHFILWLQTSKLKR